MRSGLCAAVVISVLLFTAGLAFAYSAAEGGYQIRLVMPDEGSDTPRESGYNATFAVDPGTSGYAAGENGYNTSFNIYTSGIGGIYGEDGYTLYLVPEEAFYSYSYNITAFDPAVDLTAPGITIQSPENRTYPASSTIQFNMTASEALTLALFSIDGGANNSMANDTLIHYYNTTIPRPSDGSHNATFYAVDRSGNGASRTVFFTIDSTPPSITLVSPTPANNTLTSDTWAYINASMSEPGDTAILEWNGINYTMNQAGSTSFYYNVTGLGTGEYSYRVYASDLAGNMGVNGTWTFRAKYNTPWMREENGYVLSVVIPASASSYSVAESYEMDFVINPDFSAYVGFESGYGLSMNLYTGEPGGVYTESGYILYLVPEDAFYSNSYGITANDPTTPPQSNQTTAFNITLLQGWNLISLPLAPENTSIDAVLASIDGNYTVVYAWIDCAWKKSTASRNPLTDMTVEYGYWVDMTVPDTLELTGTQPASTTINVSTGWNLVGYPSLTTRNLTDVLSPINYSVVYAWMDGAWKKSTATRNPLIVMSPGYGYWIDANGAGSYEVLN